MQEIISWRDELTAADEM